jgi:SAM-dependent methyltransferase
MKRLIPKKLRPIAKLIFYKLKGIFYLGNNVICPICNATYKKFASHGPKNKFKNSLCLNCYSVERHRLLWCYLNKKTTIFDDKTKKILHFAPEKAFYDKFSNFKSIDYYPCDINPNLYYFKIVKEDITNISFKNEYFDVIICNHVLEHVLDDNKAMLELYRVLKKDGWAILQVPIDYHRDITYEDFTITAPKDREIAFGQSDHLRCYGKDYKNRLEKAGFIVKEDNFISSFDPSAIKRFGFTSNELIYFCTK